MSGIDEQHKDTPICPVCGNRPDYWTLTNEQGHALWLYSNDYIERPTENGGLGEPYKKYLGEGYITRLKGFNMIFIQAHGHMDMDVDGGCNCVLELGNYSYLDEEFRKRAYEVYPHKMYVKEPY